ncbi:MAG: YvrJ family protein, partial [Halanaerobiales bacterium]
MLRLASSYGFPMVVAIYLLVRIEPLIRSLTRSVDTLTMMIALQSGVKAKDFEDL